MNAYDVCAHTDGKQDFMYISQLVLLLIILWGRSDFHFHFFEEKMEDQRD